MLAPPPALRKELGIFWYWRQRLDEATGVPPEEAVRWHHSLRTAAQAWAEAYGGCRHESLGEVDEKRDVRETNLALSRPYLERTIEDLVPSSPSRPGASAVTLSESDGPSHAPHLTVDDAHKA